MCVLGLGLYEYRVDSVLTLDGRVPTRDFTAGAHNTTGILSLYIYRIFFVV